MDIAEIGKVHNTAKDVLKEWESKQVYMELGTNSVGEILETSINALDSAISMLEKFAERINDLEEQVKTLEEGS